MQDEPTPSASRGAVPRSPSGLGGLRRPLPVPRMQAFAVGTPSTSSAVPPSRPVQGQVGADGGPGGRDLGIGEPPSAKRKQIETRHQQLSSLRRMEERYKNLAAQPPPSKEAKKTHVHRCNCHRLAMYVLDIRKAISHAEVEWVTFKANNPVAAPDESILYSLVEGRGELIMFGGIQKDMSAIRGARMGNRDNSENDSVSNALYFLTTPCHVV